MTGRAMDAGLRPAPTKLGLATVTLVPRISFDNEVGEVCPSDSELPKKSVMPKKEKGYHG